MQIQERVLFRRGVFRKDARTLRWPSVVRKSLCYLLAVLMIWLLLPMSLFAREAASASPFVQNNKLITQEIHYRMPEAGEVFLVWGINGWTILPEAERPQGTVIENQIMHTLMSRQNDTFIAKVQVPAGATMDYGFLITKTQNGAPVKVWEANGDQDYRTVVTEASVAEVQTKITLAPSAASAAPSAASAGGLDIGAQRRSLLWLLVGVSVVFGIGVAYKRFSARH